MGREHIKELSKEAFRRLTGVQKPTFDDRCSERSPVTKNFTGWTALQAFSRRQIADELGIST